MKRLESDENYGVIGGYGNLLIVDADNEKILDAFSILEDTFTVKTGNGTHLYYYAPGFEKSIALQEETEESTREKLVFKNIGHMTFKGRMVVGPNCIHYQLNEKTKLYEKTGKTYKIIKDIPIKVVDASIVMNIIKPFLSDEIRKNYQQQNEAKKMDSTNLIKIPIDMVASRMGLDRSSAPVGYRGHNPDHPQSKSKKDLTVDTTEDWWVCSACCNSGYGYGNTLYLIALNEGILHCHECRKGGLRGDNFKKVKELAITKYGISQSYFKEIVTETNDKKISIQIGNDGRKLTIYPCEKTCFGLYDDKTILLEKTRSNTEWFTSPFYKNKIKKILIDHYKITNENVLQTMESIITEVEKTTKNNGTEKKQKEKSSMPPEDVIKIITSVGVVLSEDSNIYQIIVNGSTFKLTDEQILYGSKTFCLKYMNTFLDAIRITDEDWKTTILPYILTQAKKTREMEKEERIESNSQLVVSLFATYAKAKACFDWDDQTKRMHYQNATFYDKEYNAIRVSSEFIREFYQTENIKLRYNVTKEQFDAELRDQSFIVRKRITGLVSGIEKTFRVFNPEKIGISEQQVNRRKDQEPKDAALGIPPIDAFNIDKGTEDEDEKNE